MPLTRRLVVNSSSFETRAALLEDGVLAEIFIERARSRGVAGNIYKGRVRKVLPGMQAAFVDVGLEKDAFLYVADVGEGAGLADESLLGEGGDEGEEGGEEPPREGDSAIEELLEEGQEIVVQVAKEPFAGKGARVTAHVTLPGRYLVYMPTVRHVGVSRRIESEPERARLKEIVVGLRERTQGGYIVRTAGEGRGEAEFVADAEYLAGLWQSIGKRAEGLRPPALVHHELGLLDKLLRDVVSGDFAEILVDSETDYQRCLEFVSRAHPELTPRVKLHLRPTPLFEQHGIEAELEKALRSKVWLKSGGYIVINQTEALVAIDVNTGRYVGKSRLEDTVLRTNLEAVSEIVRQVRLRDLGGIIVLDFIDMEEPHNRVRVVQELEDALKRDRSKSKILQISDFGLVEMTRKRVKASLERLLCRPCAHCGGSGRVKSPLTLVYEIQRELLKARASLGGAGVELRVHPDVAQALAGPERAVLEELERELGARVVVRGDPNLRPEHYDFMVP